MECTEYAEFLLFNVYYTICLLTCVLKSHFQMKLINDEELPAHLIALVH